MNGRKSRENNRGCNLKEKKESWKDKAYAFFSNSNCEYFPCHKTDDTENFNCLFCYCPLYALKDKCGGKFHYCKNGIKDCSNCMVPHKKDGYGYIIGKYSEIIEISKLGGNKDES